MLERISYGRRVVVACTKGSPGPVAAKHVCVRPIESLASRRQGSGRVAGRFPALPPACNHRSPVAGSRASCTDPIRGSAAAEEIPTTVGMSAGSGERRSASAVRPSKVGESVQIDAYAERESATSAGRTPRVSWWFRFSEQCVRLRGVSRSGSSEGVRARNRAGQSRHAGPGYGDLVR